MKKNTQKASLEILNVQYEHIATRGTKAKKEEQTAYYDGMRTMLEIVLTDYHAKPGAIIRGENGKHYFVEG